MNMLATQSIARGRGNAAIDERVAQIDANGVVTFMHNDKQNSVIAISDTAGNPVVRRGYGTYGETNPAQMTGPTSAGSSAHPFGYTGRRWDPDLNLYYYRARWYDPQLGTFLETDPIGSLDYVNLYSYVGAEPGNKVDPTGMQGACFYTPDQCGFTTTDPARIRGLERAGYVMAGGAVVVTAAFTWEYAGVPVLRFLISRGAIPTGREAIAAFQAASARAGFSSAGEVGNIIGWGGGRNAAAQATARLGEITKSAVAGMREEGLTRAVATAARDVYRAAVAEGTGGATAAARLKLMEKILRKW